MASSFLRRDGAGRTSVASWSGREKRNAEVAETQSTAENGREELPLAHFPVEPRFGDLPVAIHRAEGALEHLRCLFRREPGEEAELDHAALARVLLLQAAEGVVEGEEGLALEAQPGGRFPPTLFPATEIGDSRVVFANPEHDFPQRITYSLDGRTLRARVEAQRDGEWQGFEQIWSRGSWPAE